MKEREPRSGAEWTPSLEELENFAAEYDADLSIPDYRVEGRIGRGGQATVYRATQISTGRAVALKVLRRGDASAAAFARFARERDLICRLRHPHVVAVFDAGAAGDRQFLAMELVTGPTLERWLHETQPPARETCVELLLQLCDAVAHAHRQGVTHRDLKPQNVLLQPLEGVSGGAAAFAPKIADFGLARAVGEGDPRFTTLRPEDRLSTLAYSAPELLGEHPAPPDTRMDVFGLGAILYRMLAGEDPRRGLTLEQSCATRGPAPYRPLARKRCAGRLVGGDLEAITFRAMAPNADERYPTVQELAADLRRWRAGRPVEAVGAAWTYRLRKNLTRHRAAWLGTLAVAIALGVGGGAWWRQWHLTRAQEQELATALASHTREVDDVVQRLLAPVQKALGSNAAARAVAGDLVTSRAKMLARDPDDPVLITGLAQFRERHADLLHAEGEWEAARAEYEEARRLWLSLREAADPLPARHANFLRAKAAGALPRARWRETLAEYEEVLADDLARVRDWPAHPSVAQFADDAAWSLQRTACLPLEQEPGAERAAELARARDLLREFPVLHERAAGDPARARDVLFAEVQIHRDVIRCTDAYGPEAMATRGRALAVARQVLKDDADSIHYQEMVLEIQVADVSLLMRRGELELVREVLPEVIAGWDRLLERTSRAPSIRLRRARVLHGLGGCGLGYACFEAERVGWLEEAMLEYEALAAESGGFAPTPRQHLHALLCLTAARGAAGRGDAALECLARALALAESAPLGAEELPASAPSQAWLLALARENLAGTPGAPDALDALVRALDARAAATAAPAASGR